MAVDIDLYHNREQSFIKHQFLTKYLQAASYKIFQGRSPIFNFVDAFAGPWRISDDAKYSDASFDQAINTLEEVRTDLHAKGISGLRVRFCFCEKRRDAYNRLREYAATKKQFDIHIFEGAFEDNLSLIESKLPDGFTFTFIDPTGWNIRNEDIFNFLKKQRGEFILNFMADHINRHAEYTEVDASFGKFLADAQWANEFTQLPADWSNEIKMLHLVKEAMRNHGAATHVPDFSIKVPKKERVKMRLILGTHSAKGLELFRDIQEKVEKQEIQMRQQLREGENPQVSLFPGDYIAAMEQQREGVGCKANQERAEAIIIKFLKQTDYAFPSSLFNMAMENVPIRKTQLNKLILDMRRRNIVNFELPHPRKVPQPRTRISLSNKNLQPNK